MKTTAEFVHAIYHSEFTSEQDWVDAAVEREADIRAKVRKEGLDAREDARQEGFRRGMKNQLLPTLAIDIARLEGWEAGIRAMARAVMESGIYSAALDNAADMLIAKGPST